MEELFQLVADSFRRHGIESPVRDAPVSAAVRPAEPILPTELPDHNYRKKVESAAP
jgi:hypothetical protein